jgi:hypothetical protein
MIYSVESYLIDRPTHDKPRQCPYALVLGASKGGSMVERCGRMEHHDGPHAFTTGGEYDGKTPSVLLHVEWATVQADDAFAIQRDWSEACKEGKTIPKGLIPKQGLRHRPNEHCDCGGEE